MIRNVLLAGGDGRMLALAGLLRQEGYQVETMGLLPQEEANVRKADAILLPYPFSVRDERIPTLTGIGLSPCDVLKKARQDALIIAERGMNFDVDFRRYTQAKNFEQQNAELSAEGALYEVMTRADKALVDLKLLITGYGRFARALAGKLRVLGADVWVAARRKESRELAEMDGMHAVELGEMPELFSRMDMLLNTVPAQIVPESALSLFRPDAWLLELASAPYGFDRQTAQAFGLKTALLPGLPAAYAPVSAALALRDAVLFLFQEAEK